jgi:F-type H+-transporting ATPase subunit delta
VDKVTNKTAALRYARALMDVALKEQTDLDRIDRDLAGFNDLFTQHRTLAKVLLNPAVPVLRKHAAVAELTKLIEPLPIIAKMLTMLAGRDRLVLVPDLLASFRERVLDHRHVVRADVTTTTALAADRAKGIEQSLARVTGTTVTLRTHVDASIVGGVVVRIGSTVYDGSVVRQLERMKAQLAENV